MKQIFFIAGTDTGVGKTVVTALLTQFLRERGVNAAALKPLCSGGREDARALHAAMDGALTLDEINPWHFRAAIAPSLAAKLERKTVSLASVIRRIRSVQKRFDAVLVEGAGGLLSPLGKDFNSRDLITALRAKPVIVASNKLGTVNHILLTLEALPPCATKQACVVLMSPSRPDAATKTNAILLGEFFDARKIFPLPWFGKPFSASAALKILSVRRMLQGLAS